jgi:small subunit ribosomal protein S20
VAHSLSAKKRVRQSETRNEINRARKSSIKTQIKHFEDALKSGNMEEIQKQFRAVVMKLDTVSSTSTMHKNTAARKKSRLAKRINALKTKQSA